MTAPRINLPIFGLFLEAKRIERKLTPAGVAKAADVPVDAVNAARDKKRISRRSFLNLCTWQGENPAIFEMGRAG